MKLDSSEILGPSTFQMFTIQHFLRVTMMAKWWLKWCQNAGIFWLKVMLNVVKIRGEWW